MRDIILEIGKIILYVVLLVCLVLEPIGAYITGVIIVAYVIGLSIKQSIINIIEFIKIKKAKNSHKNSLTIDQVGLPYLHTLQI